MSHQSQDNVCLTEGLVCKKASEYGDECCTEIKRCHNEIIYV